VYTSSGDINSFGWNCGSTGWIELDFRSLNHITIIATTASAIAIMEAITMPTIAPTDKALLSAICEGRNVVDAVVLGPMLEVALTNPKAISRLVGIIVGITTFAGFISLAYSAHEGFLFVASTQSVTQPRLKKVPRP